MRLETIHNDLVGLETDLVNDNYTSGEIAAAIHAAQLTHKDVPLRFICETDILSIVLTRDLEKWESMDWRGISNRLAWKALVNILRQRCAATTFRKADGDEEWSFIDKARTVAKELTVLNRLKVVIPATNRSFNLSGVKISGLSQQLAYRMIRLTYKTRRKSTQRNLESIISGTNDSGEHGVTEEEVWTSLRAREIRKPVADFLWKCIHNAHRCGAFWENIPNYEERATCTHCGNPETMEHIMTLCQAPGRDVVWDLAGSIWRKKQAEWTRPSYDEIMGVGLRRWYTPKMKRRPTAERFWRILISESAYLIWCLRCERVIGHADIPEWTHTEREISARWTSMMNKRLHLDKTMTHRRFGRQALDKKMVTGTWRGTLSDEYALPDDWTNCKWVLVGITSFQRDAHGEG
ncbi:uncharacterized protein C8Q71DRAFT_714717 [Rhodofomes roseus]|uniref:Reverse transcriptase zinc-binding domain-containing protein n=1 Tax=Rhodofomes roseus TaxID=34475 RepID=A0ABQ8K5U6_9APHY|nr:uncharacterized protein C8Q71DRAFT_714717 [Rhodofomes roseus]KAH9832069.1 hypothetical protein C8Q71DRAFT_714717 [Rhodofomes roseus]